MGFETSIPIVNFGPSLPLKTPATPSEAVKKQGVFVVWVVKGGAIQKSIMEITEPQNQPGTILGFGIFSKKINPKNGHEVEQFLVDNPVDDTAAASLRAATPEIQESVLRRGNLRLLDT